DIQNNYLAATITVLEGETAGQKALISASGETQYASPALAPATQTAFAELAQSKLQSGKVEVAETPVMVDLHQPRPHLIIIGGVHVAMPLEKFARELGFRVSIID